MSELRYKRQFRKLVGCWSEVYETRSGSGMGYPDVQLLVNRQLLPVELKTGRIVDGRLKSDRIRPSQISWHHEFLAAGGISLIAVCLGPVGAMDVWSVPSVDRETTSQWKAGWDLLDCSLLVAGGRIAVPLEDWFLFGGFPSKQKWFIRGQELN